MIVVEFEDDSQMISGRDFISWADVPKNKKIRALMITDGVQFKKVLTGYDSYAVDYEGVQKASFKVDTGSGDYIPAAIGEPEVVAERVHCIKYAGPHRRRLSAFIQSEIEKIDKALPGNKWSPTLTRTLLLERERLQSEQEKINNDLKACEVVTFSLTLSASRIDRNHMPIDKSLFREGIPSDNSEQWFEGIRNRLERKNLKIKEVKADACDNN